MTPYSHSSAKHLTEEVVDVWRAQLDTLPKQLTELLAPAERERGERMVKEQDRLRWMRARGALRVLLASYLGSDPKKLRLSQGAHGKPALAGETAAAAGRAPLSFNLAHSGGIAVYAFTGGSAAVGIDIEVVDLSKKRDDVAVAARALGAATASRLAALDEPARRREFLRAWVRHEAALKCRGVGIWGADGSSDSRQAPPELWLTQLELGPNLAGALAVQGAPRSLRLWEYPAQAPTPLQ